MTPIDDSPMPPPPSGKKDRDYLTQDIVSLLERTMMARVDVVAQARDIGRRDAAAIVLQQLREIR